MSELIIDENYQTELIAENTELKRQVKEVTKKMQTLTKTYTKEEAKLLLKIQTVKQKLNNMKISKSGKNNFQHYSYYELEDINKPITDTLLEEGLASVFLFSENVGYLKIVDSETGACISWNTPIQTSYRWRESLKDTSKKGDVGDIMKAKQALQTYARRTLYLQALEISEPNIIEREPDQEKDSTNANIFQLPESIGDVEKQVFNQIKKDFGTKVPFEKHTISNKLNSMKKNKRIDEVTYTNCQKILE